MPIWTLRKGDVAPNSNSERVYFFKKALQEYMDNGRSESTDELFNAVEQQFGVTHIPEFTELITNNQSVDSDDGRLYSLICSSSLSALFNEMKPVAITDKEDNVSHTEFLSAAATLVCQASAEDYSASRLSSLVYRAVDAHSLELQLILSELWAEGYHWDAHCLAKLLCPDSKINTYFNTNIANFVKPKGSRRMSKVAEVLELIKKGDNSNGYKESLLTENPIDLYRLLKIDVIRHEQSTDDELLKINRRTSFSASLRHIIILTLTRLGANQAIAMAADAMQFIKATSIDGVSDYFPSAERLVFQPSVGMIGDMLKAVQFSLLNKVDDSKIFDKQSGVLHKLRNIWNQRMRDFWKENGQLHRNVFIQTCSTFIDQLDIIKSIVGDEDGLCGIVSVKLAKMITTNFDVADNELEPNVIKIAHECGLSEENARKLTDSLLKKNETTEKPTEKPVAIIPDNDINLQKEPKTAMMVTKWESKESGISEINSDGDGKLDLCDSPDGRPGQMTTANSDKDDMLAAARRLIGINDPKEQNSNEQLDASPQQAPSSDSSIAGSASNYRPAKRDKLEEILSTSLVVEGNTTPQLKKVFAYGGFEELETMKSTFGQDPGLLPEPRNNFGNNRNFSRGRGGIHRN